MGKVGRPKGDNNKKSIISMRLDEQTKSRLDAYCAKMSMSKSEVIREAVKKFPLKNREAGKNQLAYVVSANTYKEGCGAEIELFGVCDNMESVEKLVKQIKAQGSIPEISKVKLNKASRVFLGGYYE